MGTYAKLPKIGLQSLVRSFLFQDMLDGQTLLPQEVRGSTGRVFGDYIRESGFRSSRDAWEAAGFWKRRGVFGPLTDTEHRYEATVREAIGEEAKVFLSRWLASFAGVQVGPDQIQVLWADHVDTQTRISWDIRLQWAGELFDVGGGIVSEAEF